MLRPVVMLPCLIVLVALLGGCAANQPERDEQTAGEAPGEAPVRQETARGEPPREETLEQILTEPLDADEYATSRRCLSSLANRDFQGLGDRYLLFRGPGDSLWLNELRGRCPGLRHATALAFETDRHQLCELDRFRPTDMFRTRNRGGLEGVPCTLGTFRPVSAEQVQALRAVLTPAP